MFLNLLSDKFDLMKKRARKKHYRQKQRKKTSYIPVLIVIVVFSVAVFGTIFYFRNTIKFYYSVYFKSQTHKKLINAPYETQRINRILNANSDKIFGFDISHYQRQDDILWDSLSIEYGNVPLEFVILRATMGADGKDKHFNAFWKKAKRHRLIRGAYHFYRPDEDPVIQARHFLENLNLEQGDLVPILDIEKSPSRISWEKLNANLKIWLHMVEKQYGRKPIIYTFYHYYKDYLRQYFSDYPLWLANYNDVTEPSPDDAWQIWQFTEQGIVHGINTKIDLNMINGGISDIKKLMID